MAAPAEPPSVAAATMPAVVEPPAVAVAGTAVAEPPPAAPVPAPWEPPAAPIAQPPERGLEPPEEPPEPVAAAAPKRRRRRILTALLLIGVLLAAAGAGALVLRRTSDGGPAPETGAAAFVPGDALAYVNVSIDGSRPAVKRALTIAARLPDYPLLAAAVIRRLSTPGPGSRVDFGRDIRPWLGKEAALALLNATGSATSSLTLLEVRDQALARAFLDASGAAPQGAYRQVALFGYRHGAELAFVGRYLAVGGAAAVRAAIDVSGGAEPSLRADGSYQRAAAGEPSDRVLDAYLSAAGVRRLLRPRSGLPAGLGSLLDQPALLGTSMSLSPDSHGARIRIHSALDPTLAHLSGARTSAFSPSLQAVMPAGSILMFDVNGLDRVAPRVLAAAASTGIAAKVGPLLSRLGAALSSEGVDVADVTSIFHHEAAVGIVAGAGAPTLIVVARTPNQAQTQAELAQLELPLAQLFPAPSAGPGQAPEFNDRQVGGVTAHQLSLTTGLQVDYAVFHGLVVISTSLQGIAAVAEHARTLGQDPGYTATLGNRPDRVSSLLFLDFSQLLRLAERTGLTSGARYRALQPDLDEIRAVGLTSTSGEADSTAELTLQIL
ncbi:MAG: DUF3352 domain-containing protein [Solirubrobacterales bacterium]|nr:DUF3352 domain-containing protein [Solirubrobacterales bacterium]